METTFNLDQIFSDAVRRWPLILGLSLLGALAGLIFSLTRSPQYQAKAVLGVSINYGVTESLALMVEDRTLNRVAALLVADTNLSQVLDDIPVDVRQSRGWSSPADLNEVVQLEQRLAEWWLIVTDPDPNVAAVVAQTWAEVSIATLDEAVAHAWRAVGLLDGKFDVECTVIRDDASGDATADWECKLLPIEMDAEILDGAIQTELSYSHGILPNISYELLRASAPIEEPVLWDRGLLVLAGTLAGFILSVGLSILVRRPFRSE